MSQPPPNHFPATTLTTTQSPRTLAEAVAQVRHPRNHATAQLAPHRDELLQLRAAGESFETLALALRAFNIDIGKETVRRWLAREMGLTPRRKVRRRRVTRLSANNNPMGQDEGMPPP